jgi:glycosyltransferase involved in cell wall biosynthesis
MRICLISFSRIADDTRVRRQGDALTAAGHDVVGIGLRGATAQPPTWPVIEIDHWDLARKRDRVTATSRMFLGGRLSRLADAAMLLDRRGQAVLRTAIETGADAYQANDWMALPFAARAAEANGAAYWYDTHEYAVEQRLDSRPWALVFPPFIRAVEARHIQGAAFVTTVAEGIADLLQQDHGLAERPIVLRNTPVYQEMPFRPVGEQATVLYHGVFHPGRRLETLIDSVPRWRPGLRLVLRGWGSAWYEAELRAEELAPDRIRFAPRVPHDEVVPAASAADVGFFFLPPTSNQARYSLPNKVFEYVMAGLALCVSDLPEMAAVVRAHDVGTVFEGATAGAVADALNRLSPDDINRWKKRSLDAALTLSWERERHVLLAAVDERLAARTRS